MSQRDLSPYLEALEAELRNLLAAREPTTALLYQMMQYHLGWLNRELQPEEGPRGKRLRPLLCLLACEAVGGDWQRALSAAAAIELIHNFSLIHDDIEDDSRTRRHRETVWSVWGLAQGVNTGDAMWSLARLAALRTRLAGYSAETVLHVAELLEETCLQLCTGQYLDIRFETANAVGLDDYMRMISGKTAALLATALAVGALLGGAPADVVEHYRSFGHELGITFQIVDDILGIWGNPNETGKSAASDLLARKKTLPVLHALEWERAHGLDELQRIFQQPPHFPDELPILLALLERAGARQDAERRAREHQACTLAHLQATGSVHPAQDALRELALALTTRTN